MRWWRRYAESVSKLPNVASVYVMVSGGIFSAVKYPCVIGFGEWGRDLGQTGPTEREPLRAVR